MTDVEKIAAFDDLAACLVNEWYDGKFGIWGHRMCAGPQRETREEATADLVEWARKHAKRKKTPLTVIESGEP